MFKLTDAYYLGQNGLITTAPTLEAAKREAARRFKRNPNQHIHVSGPGLDNWSTIVAKPAELAELAGA